MSDAGPSTKPDEAAQPRTVRALERALRQRILNWEPESQRDSLARLRDDVEQALRE